MEGDGVTGVHIPDGGCMVCAECDYKPGHGGPCDCYHAEGAAHCPCIGFFDEACPYHGSQE